MCELLVHWQELCTVYFSMFSAVKSDSFYILPYLFSFVNTFFKIFLIFFKNIFSSYYISPETIFAFRCKTALPRQEKALLLYSFLNSLFEIFSSILSSRIKSFLNSSMSVTSIPLLCGHTSWQISQPHIVFVLRIASLFRHTLIKLHIFSFFYALLTWKRWLPVRSFCILACNLLML